MKKSYVADLALLMVAVVWGSNFVVMKDTLSFITPFVYLGLRFSLAFIILVLIFYKQIKTSTLDDVKNGCIIGLFLFLGFALQTVGLQMTTPGKSGFITGMNVVIVPFLYYLLTGNPPGVWPIVGGVLAVIGLGFLSLTRDLSVNTGDVLTLLSAFMFAAHIVSIGMFAPKRNPVVLTIMQLGVTAGASWITALFLEPVLLKYSSGVWISILYAAIICTIGAFLIQNLAQRYTPSTHAAIILCLESVFAVFFSYFFWGEKLTPRTVLGCALIFLGVLVTELKPRLSLLASRPGVGNKKAAYESYDQKNSSNYK